MLDRDKSREPAGVSLSDLHKTFGSTRALVNVDLEVQGGTVHAFIGENGAGKSTALGAIAGRIAPDRGRVQVGDVELSSGDLRAARRAGVAAVYQELTIVNGLDAAANVYLSTPLSRNGFLSERTMRRNYEKLCDDIGVAVVPKGVLAGALPVAEQQLLEIMRSLVVDARVILLDEPTAPLAVPEREALYRVIGRLRDRAITVILVSHNLDEVERLSDSITVFRDGHVIATAERGALRKQQLVAHMLGDETRAASALASALTHEESAVTLPTRARFSDSPVVLRAENVTVPGAIEGIDVEIRAGEVLGVAGLVGSGRTTLFRALAGAQPGATGKLWIDGREVPWPRTVRASRALGIALLPEDRKQQGLVMAMSAADNVVLSDFRSCSRGGILATKSIRKHASDAVNLFGFPVSRLEQRVDTFSGGNQQKLLMGRWLHSRPRVLLADEPTRGIDIGAKAELLEALRTMAAEGVGVAIASSELEETVTTSDRVLVLSAGRATASLDDREHISLSSILHAAFNTEEAA